MKRAAIYLITITALLYVLRYFHYAGLLKNKQGYYAKYKTAFLQNNSYNVLFLGSSRAELHYDCRLFDSITGSNSFNIGIAGATPNVAYAALKIYLQRSRAPQHIIYEVDLHQLKDKIEKIHNFGNFFPFLSDKTLRQEFNRIDSRMIHFYYNPYYSWPYTGLKNISTGLHGWLGIANKYDTLYDKGFLKGNVHILPKTGIQKPDSHYIHSFNRAWLDSIIGLCKQRGIRLSLATSPFYKAGVEAMLNKQQMVNQIQSIASANGLQYLDYSNVAMSNNKNHFIDHYHLNYAGARAFTYQFAREVNNKTPSFPLKKQ